MLSAQWCAAELVLDVCEMGMSPIAWLGMSPSPLAEDSCSKPSPHRVSYALSKVRVVQTLLCTAQHCGDTGFSATSLPRDGLTAQPWGCGTSPAQ